MSEMPILGGVLGCVLKHILKACRNLTNQVLPTSGPAIFIGEKIKALCTKIKILFAGYSFISFLRRRKNYVTLRVYTK
jgi:hypothetical protein